MWPADVSISSDVAALVDRLHQGCDEISENVNVEIESRDVRLNFKLSFGFQSLLSRVKNARNSENQTQRREPDVKCSVLIGMGFAFCYASRGMGSLSADSFRM